MFRVSTCTMSAIPKISLGSAAISSIPGTSADVILVITITVTFPLYGVARFLAFSSNFEGLILAGAGAARKNFFTRTKIVATLTRLGFYAMTAVATVVLTVRVVVNRIAVVVSDEIGLTSRVLVFVCRIEALALLAVKKIIIFGGTAAVAAIPTASAVVVFIITCLISFPVEFMARGAAFLVLICGIQTLTIFTIQIRCLCATAVTTVPVTATIVVGVVTVAVSLPLPDLAPPITVS